MPLVQLSSSTILYKELPTEYTKDVNLTLSNVPEAVAQQIVSTPCFGHMWQDDAGVCPENACMLREHCSATYSAFNTPIAQYERPAPVAVKLANTRTSISRGKFKDTGKYVRKGYLSAGRRVDDLLRRFLFAVGQPPVLPHNWTRYQLEEKYSSKSRVWLAANKSYHAVLVDTEIVCRFWTNAAKKALVDLSTTMCAILRENGYRRNLLVVPEHSVLKLNPCTGRVYCCNLEEAEQIGLLIRKGHNLDV